MKITYKIIVFHLLLLFPSLSIGYLKDGTVCTSDGSYTDTKNAVADSDCLTVNLPAGSFKWSSTLIVPSNKSVTIQGSGTWPNPTTFIERSGGKTFDIRPDVGKFVRITNMELLCGVVVSPGSGGVTTKVQDGFRVDHIKIDQTIRGDTSCSGAKLGEINAWTFGLFDNIYMRTPSPSGILTVQPQVYGPPYGLGPWLEDAGWGTKDFVYLEDSYIHNTSEEPFYGVGAFDGSWGGKLVIRHNTIINHNWGHHDMADQNRHSFRAKQISNNKWRITHYDYWTGGSGVRGGGLLVYGNRLSAHGIMGSGQPLFINDYRQTTSQYGNWGKCDGNNTLKFCVGPNNPVPFPGGKNCTSHSDCGIGNYCVAIDSNIDPTTGYVCREQIGTGKINPITGVHDMDPCYEWDNYWCIDLAGGMCNPDPPSEGGTGKNMDWYIARGADAIQISRDVFNDTVKPNYVEYPYPHPLREKNLLTPQPPRSLRIIKE